MTGNSSSTIHSKYWPLLSAIPSDRLYHFSAKSPLFLRTRPGLALLNYLPCFANTISCINHSNDPSDCQVRESVFFPICLRPGYANPHQCGFDIYWDASIVCVWPQILRLSPYYSPALVGRHAKHRAITNSVIHYQKKEHANLTKPETLTLQPWPCKHYNRGEATVCASEICSEGHWRSLLWPLSRS